MLKHLVQVLAHQLPLQLMLGAVRGYRLLLKAWLGNACRFEPTCSAYALQALQRHGPWRGAALSGWRLLRCHPWCAGGCDPVPENPRLLPRGRAAGGLFTRLLPGDSFEAPPTGAATRNDP